MTKTDPFLVGDAKVSIIVPIYNEAGNIEEFHSRLLPVLNSIGLDSEVIYVDDGSTDNSYPLIGSIAREDSRVKVLHLLNNCGQTFALSAGFEYSKGEIVVFIDADMQNDPSDIPVLLDKIKEGFDLVSGWRKKRQDNFFTRVLPSVIANRVISLFLGIRLHDIGCSLKAYRRNLLQNVDFYGEIHRIIPLYAIRGKERICEVVIKHHPRKAGKSKYSLSRIFKITLDVISAYFIVKYSRKPIYFFGAIGLFFFFLGLSLSGFVVFRGIFWGGIWISPVFFISIVLSAMGLEILLMGILSEILMKVYFTGQKKRPYTIKDIIENKEEKTIE
jgi:glycosyltransferase involved in cell wall biosynthesis